MKKYSICVVGVYFGKLPEYFNLWLKSCENNRSIDFFVVGDNELENLPSNVRYVKMDLCEMKELAQRKLGMKISLEKPYKCCDFKVVYGRIFEDYLKEYEFWGHCDFDMIFGDLRMFFTNDILDKYDKILPLGHLCLYRNTDTVNSYYKLQGSEGKDYKTVFTTDENFAFDEIDGIYNIYKKNNLPMYDKRVFADIASVYTRFRLALKDKNYKHQVFYWEDGKVIRAYYKNRQVCTDEFIYIHFKKRGFKSTVYPDYEKNGVYLCDRGIIIKSKKGIPSLKEIKQISPYYFLTELREKLMFNAMLFMKWCYHNIIKIKVKK